MKRASKILFPLLCSSVFFMMSSGAFAAGDALLDNKAASIGSTWTQGKSKKDGGNSGYELDSYGMSVDFNTLVSYDTLIGTTLSFNKSNIYYQDVKLGDSINTNAWMLSLYAMHQFQVPFFVQGTVSVGINRVKTVTKRESNAPHIKNIGYGDYKSQNFQFEVLMGYISRIKEFTVVPMMGLGFARSGGYDYHETGIGYRVRYSAPSHVNVVVDRSDTVDGIAGISVSKPVYHGVDLVIEPEAHYFVRRTLKNIPGNTKVWYDRGDVSSGTHDSTLRTNHSLGVSLAFRNVNKCFTRNTELTVGYDTNFNTIYRDHTGSIKFKIKF